MTALEGRVALLTGASGGIGQAIGRRLADEGADVCLAYGRHADDAESIADYARGLGRRAVAVAADLADPDAPTELVSRAEAELGGVDVRAGVEQPHRRRAARRCRHEC